MSTQLPLPASWAVFESRRDPRERLAGLHRDVATARGKIRAALEELADRHGIPERDVTYAMEGYADDVIGDVAYSVERTIEHEIVGDTDTASYDRTCRPERQRPARDRISGDARSDVGNPSTMGTNGSRRTVKGGPMRMFGNVVGLTGATAIAFSATAQQSNTVPPAPSTAPTASAGTATTGAAIPTSTAVPLAVSSNLFEIESSRLALQRSKSVAVKDFANQMIRDHTLAASKMKTALGVDNISVPAERLNAKDQKVYDSLKAMNGAAFDKAYIEAQYTAHVEAVNLFTAYAQNGDNPHLKALAAQLLPTLKSHLNHISKLRSS